MWYTVIIIAHLIGLISSIDAIMNTRTPQGAIAWGISLNTCPYIAVPAYWILGRSRFNGYITTKRMAESTHEKKFNDMAEQLAAYRLPEDQGSGVLRGAELLADIPFLTGNDAEILIDGEQTFSSISEGIRSAEKYILFQFFIVKDDELGRKIKAELISKANSGVEVYFLYDEIGSHSLPRTYLEELRTAGIKVSAFNTRKGVRNRFQINFRNHRKIVVVDGHTAWIGGHNVGDEYMGRDPKFGNWRDTHVKISGPAAIPAQLSFASDWHWATDESLDYLNWHPPLSSDGKFPVLVVPSGPADDYETASLMFMHAINTAKERIWIASPYFVPDDAIISTIQLASLRGVDVRVLIPDTPDHMLVYLNAFSFHNEATATGAQIYRYTNGFLHAKTMLIDDTAAAIGTANLDNRSLRLNFEITAWVKDSDFAAEIEKMFLEDFSNSRLMTKEDLSGNPWWFKLAVRIARLTAPVQ